MNGMPPEVLAYYAAGREIGRLDAGHGVIEHERTLDLLARFLPPPPARVVDVGGGPGVYAVALARQGYQVTLVDPVPLHVEHASRAAEAAGHTLRALSGDARCLPGSDASDDAALLLGPLYHLTERADRLAALREVRRVLRPGGLVLAAAVGRFASLLAGLFDGLLADPDYRSIVQQDLADGQHRNSTPRDYFTTSFFHRPEELRDELQDAGFRVEALLGVEGPAWPLPDLAARWGDAAERARILEAARMVEAEPSLLGFSAHLLAVGRAP